MADIKSIEPGKYNKTLAEALKSVKEIERPDWSLLTKSGTHKMRTPDNEDFWHLRAASILRQLYVHKIVGTERLRTRYGGRKNRGAKPARFKKGSGKIIRTILQQTDAAGLTEKTKLPKAGRRLTEKGKELLEKAASSSGAKE